MKTWDNKRCVESVVICCVPSINYNPMPREAYFVSFPFDVGIVIQKCLFLFLRISSERLIVRSWHLISRVWWKICFSRFRRLILIYDKEKCKQSKPPRLFTLNNRYKITRTFVLCDKKFSGTPKKLDNVKLNMITSSDKWCQVRFVIWLVVRLK